MENNIILTGDRPTGKLHIGHYVGSLKNRVEMQNTGKYTPYIMIADQQALTDNARDPEKIKNSLIQVALDYLAVGLDPKKSTIFVQSQIPALAELNLYYLNLATVSRLERIRLSRRKFSKRILNVRFLPASLLTLSVKQQTLLHLKPNMFLSAMIKSRCLNRQEKSCAALIRSMAKSWLNLKEFSRRRAADGCLDLTAMPR